MASSGRVLSNTLKTSSFYVDWQIASQSTSGNYTTVNWQAGLNITGGDDWYSNAIKIYSVVINGTTVYSGGTFSNISNAGDHQLASGSLKIYHNDDGKKDISVSISGWLYGNGDASGSKSWSLTSIPRYFTSTPTFGKSSKTETTYTWNWVTSETCSKVVVYVNGVANKTWTGSAKSGTITATGLTPSTDYDVYLVCTRKDSGLTSKTKTQQYSTYNYPYCTEAPSFVIGESTLLKFYNPLNRTFELTILGANDVEIFTTTASGTSRNSLHGDATIPKLYATIPNSKSGTYKVKVKYGSSEKTKTGGTYSVDESLCVPTFTNYTYKDINTDVTNVTGNDQVLVKGLSTLRVIINSANKMVAKNGATPKNYIAKIDTLSRTVDYYDTDLTFNVGTVLNNGTKRLSVTAYDSRNIPSKSVNKDIVVYNYSKPTINASITRLNNFEAQTTLKVNGAFSKLTIDGTDKNTLEYVRYRYKEVGGSWSSWVNLTTSIVNGKYTCNDIILSLDITKSFNFEIIAKDKLSSYTVSKFVDVGEAIFFVSSNKKACYINGDKIPLLHNIYPVGSVYISSSNSNPSSLFGGTWELFDKEFKNLPTYWENGNANNPFTKTSNTSSCNVRYIRNGHVGRLGLEITTAVDLSESNVSLGTLDLEKLGITTLSNSIMQLSCFADAGNSVVGISLGSTGNVQSYDVISRDGSGVLPKGSVIYLNTTLNTYPEAMVDSHCSKFYWRRTK